MPNLRMAEGMMQKQYSYIMSYYPDGGDINNAQEGCWFMPSAYNITNKPIGTYFLIVYKNTLTQKVDIALGLDFFCIRVNNTNWYKFTGTAI